MDTKSSQQITKSIELSKQCSKIYEILGWEGESNPFRKKTKLKVFFGGFFLSYGFINDIAIAMAIAMAIDNA